MRKRGRASIHQKSQTRAEEKGNNTPKYSYRRKKKVSRSSGIQGLVQKRIRVWIHKNSRPRAEEERSIKVLNYFESRAEENSDYEIHQKILHLAWNEGRISGIIIVENLE